MKCDLITRLLLHLEIKYLWDSSDRAPVPAKEALREFFVEKHKQYNEELILAFIKELGIFPPGSYVTLNNGETAVVIRRQKDTPWPIVCSVLSPRGGPYARPLKRSTDSDQFGIKSVCTPTKKIKLNLHMLWDYMLKKFHYFNENKKSTTALRETPFYSEAKQSPDQYQIVSNFS